MSSRKPAWWSRQYRTLKKRSAEPERRRRGGEQPHAKEARNAEIVRLHMVEGMTLASVGDLFGVSRERVRQIVRRAGVTVEQSAALRDKSVEWSCLDCGKTETRPPSRAECVRCQDCDWERRRIGPDGQPSRGRGLDGHWWCRDPRTGKRMRFERYLAQEQLGRVLRSDEYVTLIDRDPDNVDPTNIVVTDARTLALRRYGHIDSIPSTEAGEDGRTQ